jgi:hypothetical protein
MSLAELFLRFLLLLSQPLTLSFPVERPPDFDWTAAFSFGVGGRTSREMCQVHRIVPEGFKVWVPVDLPDSISIVFFTRPHPSRQLQWKPGGRGPERCRGRGLWSVSIYKQVLLRVVFIVQERLIFPVQTCQRWRRSDWVPALSSIVYSTGFCRVPGSS